MTRYRDKELRRKSILSTALSSLTLILVKGASTVMHLSTARAIVVYTEPVRLMWIRANTYGVTKGNTYSWAFKLS